MIKTMIIFSSSISVRHFPSTLVKKKNNIKIIPHNGLYNYLFANSLYSTVSFSQKKKNNILVKAKKEKSLLLPIEIKSANITNTKDSIPISEEGNNINRIIGIRDWANDIDRIESNLPIFKEINNIRVIPAIREWANSTYTYNKVNSKPLPVADIVLNNLIKSYFNIKLMWRKRKLRRSILRYKRLSLNRILVSKAEIKQTNNRVTVNLYIYNRNEIYLYLRKLSLRAKKKLYLKSKKQSLHVANFSNVSNQKKQKSPFGDISKKIKNLRVSYFPKRKKDSYPRYFFKRKNKLSKKLKRITIKSMLVLKKTKKIKNIFIRYFKWNKNRFKRFEDKFYNKFITKLYKKQLLFFLLEKNSYVNKNKLETWFLTGIKSLVSKIYNKPVDFNIVNLKYFYHNSDIFTQIIAIKLKKRKNRLLKILKRAVRDVRIPEINLLAIINQENIEKTTRYKLDSSSYMYADNFVNKSVTGKDLNNIVLNSTKYKIVDGIRIEAAGRLSKRLTASRSVFKYKYRGSLRDKDSFYRKISSLLFRGHARSNIQWTNIRSKSRNGAFGLKGWVSQV